MHYLKIKQKENPTKVTNAEPLAPEYQRILEDYKDVFPEQLPKGLLPRRNVDHKIILELESKPPFGPVYRISFKKQDELKKQLQKLLQQGAIQPSVSPYGAQFCLYRKRKKHSECV